MAYVFVGGSRIEVRESRSLARNNCVLTRDHLRRIERTMSAIPHHHAILPRRIEIRQRARAGGSINAIANSDSFFVVLDFDCFVADWNNRDSGVLYTLLHEMGHVVAKTYDAMRLIRRADRAAYDALCARPHNGVTQGDEERFADTYADIHDPSAEGRIRYPDTLETVLACPIWRGPAAPQSPQIGNGPTAMA